MFGFTIKNMRVVLTDLEFEYKFRDSPESWRQSYGVPMCHGMLEAPVLSDRAIRFSSFGISTRIVFCDSYLGSKCSYVRTSWAKAWEAPAEKPNSRKDCPSDDVTGWDLEIFWSLMCKENVWYLEGG
jgi:hypothetical protein